MNNQLLKKIMNWLIVASLLIILIVMAIIYSEYIEVKDYCDSIPGELITKPLEGKYYCNDELLVKTTPYGWLLESELPIFSEIIFKD